MKIIWWVTGIILLMAGAVWWQWPDEEPKITMCDVGQGDGLVITQGFSQLLIDTGSVESGILPCLAQVMPFWDRYIEGVIITHTDADHAGALGEVLERYEVGAVITNETSMEEITSIVGEQSQVMATWYGQTWLWGSIRAIVLWPLQAGVSENDNRDSLVMRLELSKDKSIWLAGDTDTYVEEKLIQMGSVISTTILKIAHHGSSTSSSVPFLEIMRPSQAWISVGKSNRYGHPSQEVIERLMMMEIEVKRTDEVGEIHF